MPNRRYAQNKGKPTGGHDCICSTHAVDAFTCKLKPEELIHPPQRDHDLQPLSPHVKFTNSLISHK